MTLPYIMSQVTRIKKPKAENVRFKFWFRKSSDTEYFNFHDPNVYFDVVKFKCAGGRGQIYKAHIRVHTPWPDSENRPSKQTYTFN